MKDFEQIAWSPRIEEDLRNLMRLAVLEDARDTGDLTTQALVPADATGSARIVARRNGVVAGLRAVPIVLEAVGRGTRFEPLCDDATIVEPGRALGRLHGRVAEMLVAERLVLNLLGRLSGIATLTKSYTEAIAGTGARLYDTRKTTPGWRLLEKYAVRCGGGFNHRAGLYAAVLIKDNHLAFAREHQHQERYTPREAVLRAKGYAEGVAGEASPPLLIEVEVDTLAQLEDVLPAAPDIVLLDNMTCDQLREAVRLRDAAGVSTELESSGGVTMETICPIAETGVERISVGALTHSAVALDIGLDWDEG